MKKIVYFIIAGAVAFLVMQSITPIPDYYTGDATISTHNIDHDNRR